MTARRLVASAALCLAACVADGLDAPLEPAALDRNAFRCQVEPVLVARCAFFACHGSARRPYRVYAPQRLRLDVPGEARELPLTAAEEEANYDMARGFADGGAESLLVRKPLAAEAGGAYHRGALLYGGEDVFDDRDDPGLVLLAEWIAGSTAADDCQPTTEVGP